MKFFVFLSLLLATIAVAELSEDCLYVNTTRTITDVEKLKNCFETYIVHPEVVSGIIRSLEIIHDIYPYTDIAQKPPSEPAGYFKAMNFTSELEKLKTAFEKPDLTVADVFRPTMKLVNGFRDGHFSFTIDKAAPDYFIMLSNVNSRFPFKWEVSPDGNRREVFIYDANSNYLDSESCEIIDSFYSEGYYAKLVDGRDAFEFFSNFFGEYNTMKSPQGKLFLTKAVTSTYSFRILQYPLEDLFDSHTITFSDPSETTVTFKMAFLNKEAPANTREALDTRMHLLPKNLFDDVSMEDEKSITTALMNFKKREVRKEHTMVPCGLFELDGTRKMNYMQIDSFSYSADQYMQEVTECVEDFDKNDAPITIILPFNGGGSAQLRAVTQLLLTPSHDFRVIRAMRKSEHSRHVAVDEGYIAGFFSDNKDTCDSMDFEIQLESFWKASVTDDFGDSVIHERTDKAFESFKSYAKKYLSYRMQKHIRKPTEIIIATDGFCFSACSFFVDNAIRAGAAIAAGFSVTNPGDELFAAGQCPSGVIDVKEYFKELNNNTELGLDFRSTITESYDVSKNMDEIIPGDYSIYPVDVHTGYYNDFDPDDSDDREDLLRSTFAVYENYKTKCNPKNKKLLLISDECNTTKPNAVLSGYACGDEGEWNKTECKVATCEEGYVVDFASDECVPNPCDTRYNPQGSSATPSVPSASDNLRPMMAALFAAFIILSIFI